MDVSCMASSKKSNDRIFAVILHSDVKLCPYRSEQRETFCYYYCTFLKKLPTVAESFSMFLNVFVVSGKSCCHIFLIKFKWQMSKENDKYVNKS